MDQHLELFAALAAPFMPEEVRTRPQGVRQLQYITARTVMNRLDDVLGPAGWWDEYVPLENSVICRLTIRLPDGTTLTKSDAGGYAGMADSGDDEKSGFSDAFKRAAVKFGIGRYLYRDGVPRFVHDRVRHPSLAADPAQHAHPAPAALPHSEPAPSSSRPVGDVPTVPQSGKALFAWIKKQDEKHGFGLLKTVSDWAKRQDFPARMVQWNAEQVQQAFIEAQAAIQSIQPTHTQPTPLPSTKGTGRNGSKGRDNVALAESVTHRPERASVGKLPQK
jgi:Rad52/22 family double-strand break repair protein